MPTPAWRAICSSGASRPWSQNTCRAASTMASRCALGVAPQCAVGWAVGGRHGRSATPGIRRLASHCAGREVDRRATSVYGRSGGDDQPMLETTGREAVLVQDAARDPDDGAAGAGGAARPGSALPAGRPVPPGPREPVPTFRSCRASTPGIPTEASTTCGTSWRGRPAPATAPARAAPSKRARPPKGALLALADGAGRLACRGDRRAEEREEGLGDTNGEACCSG